MEICILPGLSFILFSVFRVSSADIKEKDSMKYLALKNPATYAKAEPIFIFRLEVFTIVLFLLAVCRLITVNLAYSFSLPETWVAMLQISTFFIDILFSIEFVSRFLFAYQNKGIRDYFLVYQGWLDLFAFLPSLLFYSFPILFAFITNFYIIDPLSFCTLFILFKIPRVLRAELILNIRARISRDKDRLLPGTSLLGHHTRYILTVILTCLLFFFSAFSWYSFHWLKPLESVHYDQKQLSKSLLKAEMSVVEKENIIQNSAKLKANLISVHDEQRRMYLYHDLTLARMNFLEYFANTVSYNHAGMRFMYSIRPVAAQQANFSLIFLGFSLMITAAVLLTYTVFAYKNLAKPLRTMAMGLSRWDQNDMVLYGDPQPVDEITSMVDAYNHRWLPLKAKLKQTRQNKLEQKVSKEQSMLRKLTE